MTNETPGPCGTHRQHTILIVDDDPASRTCFVEVLEGLGHYPLQAADGGEALRILIETPPDLIFTDLMMPGMDGLEFLTLSRTHAPGLPLVLITACDQSEVADEALTCGAAGFLRKPVSLTDLTATLQRFLPTPASETSGSGPCPPVSTSRTCDGGMEVDSSRMQSLAGLDPSLLRKATQLSFLTRFASTLRLLPAAMGPRERQAAPPSMEFLVRRSLDVILRALAGNQAVMALTDDGRVQPIMASGRSTRQLPLETVTTHAREAGADHSWHGVVHGMPLLAAPLNIQGGEVGLICVGRDPGAAAFTWADRELLAAFSTAMAMTLENACLRRQLEQAFQETVTSLILTLEARDKYTEGHSLRVAKYACGIAGAQRLPPALREQIRTASLLHDLGKVRIRDVILDKPGRLTAAEWAAMREHPVLGWKILEPLGFLATEAEGVRHHHERFDGTGYPDALAAEAIPLPARIIAVADAFDAMTTPRSYRPSRSVEDALAELQRTAGAQFDPTLVNTFQNWFQARSHQESAT